MVERRDHPTTRPLPEDVLCDALELPPDARTAFIVTSFPDDAARQREVNELLTIAEREPALIIPPDDPDLPPVVGNYEIIGPCGRGGMGFVYEARDLVLRRPVAMKVLPEHLSADDRTLANFEREARVVASLNHPHIAVLHSKETQGDTHFLTMEFVAGRTLQDVLGEGPLTVKQVRSYFGQIVDALDFAHRSGIVHLDLKPANVMITDGGQVKILDFGISRALQPTPTGGADAFTPVEFSTPWGTPGYMSPEQQARGRVDYRTDYWALGWVLFECLTGVRPQNFSPRAGEGAPPLEVLPSSTPRRLRSLIARCTRSDPADRPSGPDELRIGLGLQRSRFHRAARWAAVLLLALGGIGAGVYWASPKHGDLESIEQLDDHSLRGLDQNGHTIWTLKHSRPVQGTGYWASAHVVRNEDGPLGALVTTYPMDEPSQLKLLVPETGQTIWSRDAGWDVPVNGSGALRYRWALHSDWPGQDDPILIALLRDGMWYSCAVEFLDLGGNRVGMYYNPGAISYFGAVDTDGDGTLSHVFFGDNSSARFVPDLVAVEDEAHCAMAVILDADDIHGQAFPYSRGLPNPRDWPDVPEARERAYVLIPPHPALGAHTHIMTGLDSVVGNGTSGDAAFQASISDGRVFFLDAELRPLRYYVVMESPLRELPAWPDLAPVRCLYLRDGAPEWVAIARTD